MMMVMMMIMMTIDDSDDDLHRGGQIQGSRFPESFGGACDGDELVD